MLTELINKYYERLNETDIYILERIVSNENKLSSIGIEELAKLCNTSKSTIMRLTKKIGFSGYSEFKNYLKWENKNNTNSEINNELFSAMNTDFQATMRLLEDSLSIQEVVKKIYDSNMILLYSTGVGQKYCASEMQRLFMQLNKHMYRADGYEEFNLSSKNLKENDLVFIFSLSGDAKGLEDVLHILKLNKVTIVSITNMQQNKLSTLADYRLYMFSSPLEVEQKLIHNSFSNAYVVIEYLFRAYFKYKTEVENV